MKFTSTFRWVLVAIIAFTAMTYAILTMGYISYVESWGGSMFKTMSGGCLGYAFSRYVMKLDLSKQTAEQRPISALSQAIVIAAGMIGVPYGV